MLNLTLNLPPSPYPHLLTLFLTLLTTSEALSSYVYSALFKTLSSLSFFLGGIALLPTSGSPDAPRIAFIAGLGLSVIGDILLIPSRGAYMASRTTTTTKTESPGPRFKAGMLFFALAHLSYIISFLSGSPTSKFEGELFSEIHYPLLVSTFAAGVAVSWSLGLLGGRSLLISVPVDMKWPVRGYVGIIAGMLATGVATSTNTVGADLCWRQRVLGAGMFALSDVFVARDVFGGGGGRWGRMVGWWLYFWGQMVLAGLSLRTN